MRQLLLTIFIFIPLQLISQEYNQKDVVKKYSTFFQYTNADTMQIMQIIRHANAASDGLKADSAMLLFQHALDLSKKVNFNDGIALSLFNIGWLSQKKGSYRASINLFQQARTYCPISQNKKMIAIIYYNMGVSFFHQGSYDTAAYYFYKTIIEINQKGITEPYIRVNLYKDLGALWLRLGQLELGRYFLENGERIAYLSKDPALLSAILSNKGDIYMQEKDYKKAHECYLKTIMLAKKSNNITAQQIAVYNIGRIYAFQHMPEKAIAYYKEAIELTKQTVDYRTKIIFYYDLGEAYYLLKQYTQAEECLLPAIQQAQAIGLKDNMIAAYGTLANIYNATKQYRKAFEYQRAYTELYETLLNKETLRMLDQLEMKYRTAEKDKELLQKMFQLTEQEHRLKNKNIWIGGVSIGGLLLMGLLISLYKSYKHKQGEYKKQIQIMKQQEELSAWQAMVAGEEKERTRMASELHDGIGGLLSTISMYFGTIQKKHPILQGPSDYQGAMDLLTEALGEIRKTAHNLMPDLLLRYGIAEAIRLFCKKVQKSNDLNIDFQYYGYIGRFNGSFEISVYRIVQELIQNILKHPSATDCLVQLSLHDNVLSITVEDNGIGIKNAAQEDKGIGLQSIEARIKSLNGYFAIDSTEGNGTTAYLEFDLQHQKTYSNKLPEKNTSK